MKALVVDDDPGARYLLRRVLMRDFNYTVVEAEDGVEALAQIDKQHFSVVLLDVRMPILDGIETLQQIRNSPKHASLPIVMTTAQKDEATVRRAVALGITDYLVKTSDAQSIAARLSRALSRRHDAGGHRRRSESLSDVSLTADSVVMVVDGDADFRHFFMGLFQARYRLREAKTTAQALKMCREVTPTVVFVGEDVGMMSRECFVQKAREDSRMAATTFVAVVPKGQVADTANVGLYDGVAARSFVPEVFLRQISRLFAPPTHLNRFLETHTSFRRSIITATEQVFGMMLAEEISVCTSPSSVLGDRSGVSLRLNLPGEGVALTLALAASTTTSRLITARMIGAAPDDVADEDANSGFFEIANVIGGRLQNSLTEQGLTVRMGLPSAEQEPTSAAPTDISDRILLTFAFEKGHPTFTVSLQVTEEEPESKGPQ